METVRLGDLGLRGAAAAALAMEGGGAWRSSASACRAAWGLKKCSTEPAYSPPAWAWLHGVSCLGSSLLTRQGTMSGRNRSAAPSLHTARLPEHGCMESNGQELSPLTWLEAQTNYA